MSHKHDNLIRDIFKDPVSTNIQWREIESLLRHLGAEIESLSGTRVRVKLNGHEGILHRPHGGNTLGRQDVQHLREFMARGRVTPSLARGGEKTFLGPAKRAATLHPETHDGQAPRRRSRRQPQQGVAQSQDGARAHRGRAGRRSVSRSSRSASSRSTRRTSKPTRRRPCARSAIRFAQSDALLFVTPEYNRSVPGVLKNAIDVGSRPYGKSVWAKKPAAVVSVSPGAIGGFGANQHLRQSFVFLDVPAMPAPEAYIGGAGTMFDEQGALTNESTRGFITKFMQAFARVGAALCRLTVRAPPLRSR